MRNPLTVAESRTTSYFCWLRNPQQNKCDDKMYAESTEILFVESTYIFEHILRLYLESRNIQTQNCSSIQCTVWPRNGFFFSESEPEQLRSVSDFQLLSGSDEEESTALDALALSYVRGRGRGHAVVWDRRV